MEIIRQSWYESQIEVKYVSALIAENIFPLIWPGLVWITVHQPEGRINDEVNFWSNTDCDQPGGSSHVTGMWTENGRIVLAVIDGIVTLDASGSKLDSVLSNT